MHACILRIPRATPWLPKLMFPMESQVKKQSQSTILKHLLKIQILEFWQKN